MLQTITEEQLRKHVPSAFAIVPWRTMSHQYRMIPTISIVKHLQEHGFLPIQASQSRTRIPGKADFIRHIIRFSQPQLAPAVNDIVPQIVLSNSHDGTASYKIMLGLFRLVCLNGMMVHSSSIDEVSVRHTGPESLADDVLDASYSVIDQAPQAIAQIQDWSRHELDDHHRLAYAEAALELHDATLQPSPAQLLKPRRNEDAGHDVWTTFNVVQENMIRGGQCTRNATGQRRHVRAVKSLDEDLRLNRALWKLTEALANQP